MDGPVGDEQVTWMGGKSSPVTRAGLVGSSASGAPRIRKQLWMFSLSSDNPTDDPGLAWLVCLERIQESPASAGFRMNSPERITGGPGGTDSRDVPDNATH